MGVHFQQGTVISVEEEGAGWQIVNVLTRPPTASLETLVQAFSETTLFGRLSPGDRVVLNTTARDLKLGTGGFDFVYWVYDRTPSPPIGGGHLMKLRYTPLQRRVLSVEETESPWRQKYLQQEALGLQGRPVVVIGLHSQLAGVVAGIQLTGAGTVAFVQLDGGALPAPFSRLLRLLRERANLVGVVTTGHAYGGDLEAISPASGLISAAMMGAQVIVAGPGPGIAGTGTVLGNTATTQSDLLNLVPALDGKPIHCLRLSCADRRDRHHLISHHSITNLRLARQSVWVPLPRCAPSINQQLRQYLRDNGVFSDHAVVEVDTTPAMDWLRHHLADVTTMGRDIEEDPLAFQGAAAAGLLAGWLSRLHPNPVG